MLKRRPANLQTEPSRLLSRLILRSRSRGSFGTLDR